jgi:RNA polymerase subunit RPABC4/transcription elongation factor Spt4
MSEKICVMCKGVYDTKDITIEQRIIADEAFCPICWDREITAYSEGDMDFSFLEGLVK